jgi:hypothetical protein
LSRWPHRVRDLGPFQVLDATSTSDVAGRRLAVTLVNRSTETEAIRLCLRQGGIAGTPALTTVTESERRSTVAGVEEVELVSHSVKVREGVAIFELPASSYALFEAEVSP